MKILNVSQKSFSTPARYFFGLLFLLLNSCGTTDREAVELKVDVPKVEKQIKGKNYYRRSVFANAVVTPPYAPETVSGFDCLLVNVVGPGIGDWENNQNRVSLEKNFSYFGSFSNMISLATGGEVTVKIKKGSNRFIQLIGVRSKDGNCPERFVEEDLKDLEQFPGLFIVGAVQKDIYQNEVISLKSEYSVETTSDVRGTEEQPNPPNVDKEVPKVPNSDSGNILEGEVAQNAIEVIWLAAQDRGTLESQLSYRLMMTNDENNNLATEEEINAATEVMPWALGQTSYIVTGLSEGTTYKFLVFVKDSSGNVSKYQVKNVTTPSATRYKITYHKNDDVATGTVPTDSNNYV